jgi:diguanylate cyclase (GGDEF)-like protein
MRLQGTFLESRIGRRVFALFCVAALLPVTVLWLLTQRAVEDESARVARDARHELAKSYALAVFERLDTAARIVDRLPDAPQALDPLAPVFEAVRRLDGADDPMAIALRAAADRAGPAVRLLVLPARGGEPAPRIVLLRRGLAAVADAPRVAAVLAPDYLWGRIDELPAGIAICVRDATGADLFCPGGPPAADAVPAWQLFLKPGFGVERWDFSAGPAPAAAPPPAGGLLGTFGLVAAGTVLLVALLSLVQIRRTLGPLSRLVDKTREVAAGDYRPLSLPRDTEFGALGAAFDAMGARIDGQLATLHALAEIDRRILSALDLDGIIALVLERAHGIAPRAGMVVVHLRTPEAGLLDVYQHAGSDANAHRRVPFDTRALRRLAREGAEAGWRPAGPDDPWHALLAAAGIDAHRLLLLSVRGRPVGAVALGAAADGEPRLAELCELGERVAVAVAAKERDDLLVFQARHDALTGLPNRFDAIETLNGALRRAAAGGGRVAVLFIDLDRFKAINDGLGHAVGDAVLSEMARQIGAHLPAGCYLARWGGDEFVAVLDPAGEPSDVATAAGALIAALARPLRVGATELELRCSVGIALHPGDGEDAEGLLRNADIAMYRAKQAGRGCCVFFEERMNLEAASRIRLQADLRAAIRDRHLHLEFQPRVDTRDGRIVAAEALARWVHPEEGPVPPALFVRLAEEAGLIDELGEWAIEEACRAFASWRAAGAALRCVSVNVSSRQLRGDALVRHVRAAMTRHGLRPGDLEIEMTESVLARDLGEAAVQLEALRTAGATVAVDDFGTGYSSLAYLRRLPVDTIKIDRSFIVDMVESHAALALVRAIVAMGEALGKQLVAEGVENDEQVAILRSWGCHYVQGYALYPPLGARRLLDELLS